MTRHEDVIYINRALYEAKKITYIDRVMFLYRNNYSSETHRKQKVEDLYGPILESWKDLLKWHEEKHPMDIETIKTVKHMICVYAMEGVEALYQSGATEQEAEILIDQYLCREYLDDYKIIVLSQNRYRQIQEYYEQRAQFISRHRKLGKRAVLNNQLKTFGIMRKIRDKKKYKEKLGRRINT